VSKYEEQLEECKRYKLFLVNLTPIDWFEEQAILKALRDLQRRDLAQGAVALPEPEDDEEVAFFQQPHQLLEIYNDMEVSNLELLQQSQEIEGMLESLKSKMQEARATNDSTSSGKARRRETIHPEEESGH